MHDGNKKKIIKKVNGPHEKGLYCYKMSLRICGWLSAQFIGHHNMRAMLKYLRIYCYNQGLVVQKALWV